MIIKPRGIVRPGQVWSYGGGEYTIVEKMEPYPGTMCERWKVAGEIVAGVRYYKAVSDFDIRTYFILKTPTRKININKEEQ